MRQVRHDTLLTLDPPWVIEHAIKSQLSAQRAAQAARQERLARAREKERKIRQANVVGAFRNGERKRIKVALEDGKAPESEDGDEAFLPEDKEDDEKQGGIYLSKEVRELMAKCVWDTIEGGHGLSADSKQENRNLSRRKRRRRMSQKCASDTRVPGNTNEADPRSFTLHEHTPNCVSSLPNCSRHRSPLRSAITLQVQRERTSPPVSASSLWAVENSSASTTKYAPLPKEATTSV